MAFAPAFFKDSGFNSPDIPGVIVISIGLLGSIVFVSFSELQAPIVGRFNRRTLWITGFVLMALSFGGFLAIDALNVILLINSYLRCLN